MADLKFEASTHTYTIDGRIIPSVTGILRDAGVINTKWFDDYSRWRGSYIHLATQYLDQGILDWDTVRPELKPYIDGWTKFKQEIGFVPDLIEQRVYSKAHDFCGTLDRTGTIRGGMRVLADLKTGSILDSTRLQLAGYLLCLEQPYTYTRMAIRITKTGKYSCKCYSVLEYPHDRDGFLRALAQVRAEAA